MAFRIRRLNIIALHALRPGRVNNITRFRRDAHASWTCTRVRVVFPCSFRRRSLGVQNILIARTSSETTRTPSGRALVRVALQVRKRTRSIWLIGFRATVKRRCIVVRPTGRVTERYVRKNAPSYAFNRRRSIRTRVHTPRPRRTHVRSVHQFYLTRVRTTTIPDRPDPAAVRIVFVRSEIMLFRFRGPYRTADFPPGFATSSTVFSIFSLTTWTITTSTHVDFSNGIR